MAKIYLVKSGDTASAIAKKYGITVAQLQANNPQYKQFTSNANYIQAGWSLNIPTTPTAPTPTPTPTPTPQQSNAAFQASQPAPQYQQAINTTTTPGTPSVAPPTPQQQTLITGTQANGMTLPTGTITTPGVGNASGTIEYASSMQKSQADYQKFLQDQLLAQQQKQTEATSSWKSLIMGAKSPDTVAQEAQLKWDAEEAKNAAEVAELKALNLKYATIEDAEEAALLASTNKLAPMIFIRGEQAQIQNQFAIQKNALSREINVKAAALEYKNNRFEEAQKYIANAVAAATAQQKYNMDMYSFFYDNNQDIINRLDTEIQNAYSESMTHSRWEYEQATQAAQQKIDNEFKRQGLDIDLMQEKRLGAETTGIGVSTNVNDILQDAINNDATPANAARAAAAVYENIGIQVTQKDLNNWTTQASGIKKQITPLLPEKPKQPPSVPQAASLGKQIKETSRYIQTLGGRPEIIGGAIVKSAQAIGSFFQGLFGR